MSLFPRPRPTARGAALLTLAGMLGLYMPAAAAPPPSARPAAASDNVLTLYSEPGLRGRHATYRASSEDVERQGFAARSAASTGLWTLCEGGEVASRCQTVNGPAPELKLSPRIVRPGLNALALYDQPGLKGRQVIYSFAADRPAPFHARSARTWGGSWSLCDRGFKRCQRLDGRNRNLDLVVAAVRPESGDDVAQTPDAPPAVQRADPPRPTPVASRSRPPSHAASRERPAKLVRARLPEAKPAHAAAAHRGPVHVRSPHADREPLLTPVHERLRMQHDHSRRLREAKSFRYEPVLRYPHRARLVQVVAERHSRRIHAAHRRLYHRVRLLWGDRDPYLYDDGPRGWTPPPPW